MPPSVSSVGTTRKVRGARLLSFHSDLARQPREPSPQVTIPVQPPDSTVELALLSRLRKYQTSCNPNYKC
uniref:RxLR effector candidate protein n=1 Tax=Hyaloperonospora arabidopsidis (strain Emoy2) TaxID=559515 RepID=M4B7M3_HYAAE